jgi:hypothetical protein
MSLTPDQHANAFIGNAEPRGVTQAMLEEHRIKLQLVVDLIKAGLAKGHVERVRAGDKTIKVTRVALTDAGRRALAH